MHKVLFNAQKAAFRQPRSLKQISAQAQFLQHTDRSARIRPALALRLFQSIQLFQNHQRQNHRMLLEAVQRVRRLNQHIGIQHVSFLHSTSPDIGFHRA